MEENVLEKSIYIRMRNRVQARPNQIILLKDVAQIIAPESCQPKLQQIKIYHLSQMDRNIAIIDVMKVIHRITELFAEMDIQTIGPAQTIVEVMEKKKSFHRFFSFNMVFTIFWLYDGDNEFS